MIPTGCQIAAARKLCGMSREDLAAKSFVSVDTIGVWERSSGTAVSAKPAILNRAIAALKAEGVTITTDGVRRESVATAITAPSHGVAA